jgi:FKBP-type peptidyl-prolyl cis-trans isomerase SlyD
VQISRNHVVTLKYQVSDRDGEIVDAGLEPIVYLHGGYGGLFDALEVALQGKSAGDAFNVMLTVDEAFGEYDPDLVSVEPRDAFPPNIQIGTEVELDAEDGETLQFRVTHIAVTGSRSTAITRCAGSIWCLPARWLRCGRRRRKRSRVAK